MRRGGARTGAALAGFAALALWGAGCGDDPSPTGGDSVAFDGRSPRVPPGTRIRVLVELRRPSLGDRMKRERLDAPAQRAHVTSLEMEANALLSALRAKDVETGSPVLYARAWAGFAVTLDPQDLPAVQALGLRAEPVRRFYGAMAEGARDGGAARAAPPPRSRRAAARVQRRLDGPRPPALALLDSGVARRLPELRGRVVAGFDAVDRDGDPSPRGRRERHGTAMAGVLVDELPRGERLVSVRVAARQTLEGAAEAEAATSDQLLAGLERTVDPDGDGAVGDHIPIALVGVSSPYSGFPGAPEAEAVRAATSIGTLVVAPAGNEGPAAGAFGTLGSPGAAADALTIGALDGGEEAPGVPGVELGLATGEGRAKLEGALLGGGGRALHAPAAPLTGRSQASPAGRGRTTGGDPLEYLTVDAAPKARGRVIVVPASDGGGRRPALAQRATAATAAGAAALVVAEPDEDRPLAPLPVGAAAGIPVIGLTGDDARRALELTAEPGGVAFVSGPRARGASGGPRPATASSRGPTYSLAPKPDLAAPGTAATLTPAGGRVFAGGTSIAAARGAAAVVRLHRLAPSWEARELAAALIATARPMRPLLATGAGRAEPAAAARTPVLALPASVAFEPIDSRDVVRQPADAPRGARTVTLVNPGRRTVVLTLTASIDGGRLRIGDLPRQLRVGPGRRVRVKLALRGTPPRWGGYAAGRLAIGSGRGARQVLVPLLVPLARPPVPKLGALRTITRAGEVAGVRFSAGSVRRTGDATAVEPAGTLRLVLVDARGGDVRELTPPGGAPDVLPGEYSYTLPGDTSDALEPGGYRFRVALRGVAGGSATAESPPFEIR